MTIKVLHSEVVDLTLLKDNSDKKETDKSFDLSFETIYNDDKKNIFCNLFNISVKHEGDFVLKAKYCTWFEVEKNITEEFKNSPFPSVNAPAIAFPFLRSFISTVTVNAGYSPAILPSINFVAFNNKEKSED